MKFDTISLAAAASDMPDPRTNPADVPFVAIKPTPQTLTNTDETPTTVVLALEGTTGQSATVTLYVLDEPSSDVFAAPENPHSGDAARRFYQASAATSISVGSVTLLRALPGKIYYRVTGAPAAASVLKIGFAQGDPFSAPAP